MNFVLYLDGMTCSNCEKNVLRVINKIPDIREVTVNYQSGKLTYKSSSDKQGDIETILQNEGYIVTKRSNKQYIAIIGFLLFIFAFIKFSGNLYDQYGISKLSKEIGLLGAFIFGLLTSLHCVGMCGGIALTQIKTANKLTNFKNSLYYNGGRILTYSIIGGLVGLLGQGFTLSLNSRGYLYMFIGAFMFLLGLRNLGVLKIKLPKFSFGLKSESTSSNSAVVGLLNGFMPCGPLQTMQLLALSTMSFVGGFTFMLAFGLGTVPIMLAFGNLGNFISKKHNRYVLKASGLVVIILSLSIISQGFAAFGTISPVSLKDAVFGAEVVSETTDEKPFAVIEDGFQIVNMKVDRYYIVENVKVKKDIPVKIVMDVQKLSPCIDTITIPDYEIIKGLVIGENEMEFTPTNEGDVLLTCWMNMVSTSIEVE